MTLPVGETYRGGRLTGGGDSPVGETDRWGRLTGGVKDISLNFTRVLNSDLPTPRSNKNLPRDGREMGWYEVGRMGGMV